jgi:hypothetical protein
MLQDADIGQALLANALEQRAHTGLMHFAAQEIVVWAHAGDVGCGLAHAKADFEHQRRAAAKGGGRVERGGCIGQHKAGAQVFKGFGLARGGAAGAAHKALDGFGVGHARRRCAVGGAGGSG